MSIDSMISFLSNKKTTLWAICGVVIIWELGRGYIAQDTAQMIANIGVILGLGANVATSQYYKKKEEQDEYISKANIAVAVSEAETGKNPAEPPTPSF